MLPSFGGSLGSSYGYFQQRHLPILPAVQEKIIRVPTRQTYCEDVEVLFVLDGAGTAMVNGRLYSLSFGCSGILCSWQFQKIRPDPGRFLDYVSIQIPYSTFIFILSTPSSKMTPVLSEDKFFLKFQGDELCRCTELVREMVKMKSCIRQCEKNRMMGLLEELLARILWGLKDGRE